MEEADSPEAGTEGAGAGADPAAIALALGHTGALDPEATAYLKKQGRLADLQHEMLAKCEAFEVSHLRWRRFGDQMKGALQIIGVLAGFCVVAAIGVMVWKATHADGTVIESFTVPPDLAARGLTGEVVAGQLLDRLGVVETPAANSVTAALAISTSSADDVKVEIPETGISIGELYRFLRKWLGHETMVAGDVVRTLDGFAVTVRVNGRDGATYAGPEAGLDVLMQKAAEHVFNVTRPTGYASYLLNVSRLAEAQAVYERVTADPASTASQKASAWNGLGNLYNRKSDEHTGDLMYRRAREADPLYSLSYTNQVGVELDLGHAEAAFRLLPEAINVLEHNHDGFTPAAVAGIRAQVHAQDADLRGDYTRAIAEGKTGAAAIGAGSRQYRLVLFEARDAALLHDGGTGAWLAQQPMPALPPQGKRGRLEALFQIEAALEHWPAVIAMETATEKAMAQVDGGSDIKLFSATLLRPWLALAKAKTGDGAGAEAVIATTPGDCYDCVRLRGVIAAEARQWGRADYWFARAADDGPSLPFAYADWGQALLARGDSDGAIAKFTIANQKGPHFADPLECWGEALMAQNRSDLGLAKFAEAEKYAPNWGRLHLKWGEALTYAGKKDEALKQFALAEGLDLTLAEKTELTRQSPHA